jgi:hypothetical protein
VNVKPQRKSFKMLPQANVHTHQMVQAQAPQKYDEHRMIKHQAPFVAPASLEHLLRVSQPRLQSLLFLKAAQQAQTRKKPSHCSSQQLRHQNEACNF